MKLCLKLVMLFAVIASMSSCKDAQSATAVASIQNLLEEIFNKDIPFTQTEVEEKCAYCDFKALCKK